MSRQSWLGVLSCSILLCVACGTVDEPVGSEPAKGDMLVEPQAHVTPTPASRCDKVCSCLVGKEYEGCEPASTCVSGACGPYDCTFFDSAGNVSGCSPKCGDPVPACIAECIEEYRATPEEEACLDRDGDWAQLAASNGVTPTDPRWKEGLCYSLRECGDFW